MSHIDTLLLKDSKKNYHKVGFGILGIRENLEHVGKCLCAVLKLAHCEVFQ